MIFSKSDIKKLVIPLLVEQFLAVAVGMADSIMVSSAGETAVSGVALVDLINVLIINIFAALGTGGAVVASQLIGAKDMERAVRSANQLIYITAIVSVTIMAVVLFIKQGLLHLLFGTVDDAVMDSALIYFTISALSYPFIALYNSGAALFRAMGNSRISMATSAVMNLINIAGNAIFVYGCRMAAGGVALSSLISRMIASVIILALLHNKKNMIYVEKLFHFKFDFRIMKRILGIGIPSSLENSVFQLGRLLLVSMISTFGTAQIAANAVANTLDGFAIIPGQAMGLALITVVGRCVGADDWQQAKFYVKKLMKLTYIAMWCVNVLLMAVLPFVLKLYNLSDVSYRYAWILIMIHSLCAMILWPMSFTLPNALRAANDVRTTMVISIFSMIVFRLGFSRILGINFSLEIIGIWIAMVIDWIFRTICFILRVRKKIWKASSIHNA